MQANNKLELTAAIFLAAPYRHCILHQITFQKIASTSEGGSLNSMGNPSGATPPLTVQ